jgi:AbrB family looped-hinge helix DNA binding protein
MTHKQIRLLLAENGRVVIPANVRRALGVKAGDEIILDQDENGFRLTTRRHRIEDARRYLRHHVRPGVSLVDDLIADRRKTGKHE